jgi:hypothetical protein
MMRSKKSSSSVSTKSRRRTKSKPKNTGFKVAVGGHKLRVAFVEDLHNEDKVKCYGTYSYDLGLIELEVRTSDAIQHETFLHECIEALNMVYELGLPHHKIQTIGAGLHQLLEGRVRL